MILVLGAALASQLALCWAAMYPVRLLIESNIAQFHGNGLVLVAHRYLQQLFLSPTNSTELVYDSVQHRLYPQWHNEWKLNWVIPQRYVGTTARAWDHVTNTAGYLGLGTTGITSHYYACPHGETDPQEAIEEQLKHTFVLVTRKSPPRHRKCFKVLVRMTKSLLEDDTIPLNTDVELSAEGANT